MKKLGRSRQNQPDDAQMREARQGMVVVLSDLQHKAKKLGMVRTADILAEAVTEAGFDVAELVAKG